jgi:AbrB family looped-hinge helix DNA binding protein
MMPTATVTSKGQITIPASVREELGLHTGSRVSFVRKLDGTYELRPQSRSITSLKGIVPPRDVAVTVDEMNEAVRAGAANGLTP